MGYDPREAAAWHVATQSIIETASVPVAIKPLTLSSLRWFPDHRDGTNQFITSRYLIPCLQDFAGWALFVDSDVLFRADVADLWALRDSRYAVQVVKHDYRTSAPRKYVGSPIENDNIQYPKKNQSSVMLLNCGHPAMRRLTPSYVSMATSQHLHRFEWLEDDLVGALPATWNHLVSELPLNDKAALAHFTLGIPAFAHYKDCEHSREWHQMLLRTVNVIGENPVEIVIRAKERA
jgi:lipopolysaccharide biosynthesis glycosyltransferase